MSRTQHLLTLTLMSIVAGVACAVVNQWLPGASASAEGPNSPSKAIVAESFILVDKQGKTRAALRVPNDTDVSLAFFDAAGLPRVVLTAAEFGSSFGFADGNNRIRLTFGVKDDSPVVLLSDDTGRHRLGLALRNGMPGLMLYDERGKERVALGVPGEGPAFHFTDSGGVPRLGLAVVGDGPIVQLYGGDGSRRVAIFNRGEGSNVGLYDEQGRPRLSLGVVGRQQAAGLEVIDPNGRSIWSAP